MLYYNTDTQEDARFTNYPFTQASNKTINSIFIPNSMFIDIHIYLPKAYAGVHICSVSCIDQVVHMQITDATGQLYLQIPLMRSQETAFLLNKYNTPCGLLQCSSQLYGQLASIVKMNEGSKIQVKESSLMFLPQCVSVACTKGLQSIDINGTSINDGCIDLKRNLAYTKDAEAPYTVSISMYSDDSQQSDTRLCYVNGTNAQNKHIIIKHNTLSDLRVLTKGNIQLIGVTDVQ